MQALDEGSQSCSMDAALRPWEVIKRGSPGSTDAREHIPQVFPDLIRGLKAEEVEVPEEIVVRCEELEVELWKGQTCLPWIGNTLLTLLCIIALRRSSSWDATR